MRHPDPRPVDAAPGRDDGFAALLSSLCLVHCLALPLLAAALPGLGLATHHHGPDWLHWALILVALPVSAHALAGGFRTHQRRTPFALAIFGFGLMATGALLHDHGTAEIALTVTGGLLVALAHVRNWQARRRIN